MKSNIILKTDDNRRFFSRPYEIFENNGLISIKVKERYFSLKKLIKRFEHSTFLIGCDCTDRKFLEERMKVYSNYSHELIFPVINEICRQTSIRYELKLPLEDVYILAEPDIAHILIAKLHNLSRMFTIVSDKEYPKNLMDELYFEYAVIVRKTTNLRNPPKDSMLIRCNNQKLLGRINIPVVDASKLPMTGHNIVQVRNVSVSDDCIDAIKKQWGGKSGIILYDLFGIMPKNNVRIDINNNADKIFLLDRKKV